MKSVATKPSHQWNNTPTNSLVTYRPTASYYAHEAEMVDVDEPGARRSSIEKPPIMIDDDLDDDDLEIEIPAIDRLPDEIIQQ